MPSKSSHKFLISLVGLLLCSPSLSFGTAIPFTDSGANPASILDTVDLFRAALGEPNNGNNPGGRREINWDGGGAGAAATVFTSPMATFNTAPVTRGAVFTTSGSGFEISGAPNPEFGDINLTYPDIFTTFSSPRLFTALGSNVLDVNFFVPGTNTPATVSGFGAVFTDVDLANTTSIQYFDASNASLGTFFVPAGVAGAASNQTLSFLGVTFTTERIASVRITTGNSPLGPNANDGIIDSAIVDVVVMDDFIYGEPQVVPEPTTLLLLGSGLAGFVLWRRSLVRSPGPRPPGVS